MHSLGKSIHLIVEKLLDFIDYQRNSRPDAKKATRITLKMLVPQYAIGLLIGKKGARLKEVQLISGATLFAQPNMLPNSTERIMSIAGDAESIQIASHQIALQLSQTQLTFENPPLILYEPLPLAGTQMGQTQTLPNMMMPMPPMDFQAMQQQMQQLYGIQSGQFPSFPIIPPMDPQVMQQIQQMYGFQPFPHPYPNSTIPTDPSNPQIPSSSFSQPPTYYTPSPSNEVLVAGLTYEPGMI